MAIKNTIRSFRSGEFRISKNLYLVSAALTILTMIMLATEFFSRCAFPSTRIPLFYLGLLVIYSLHKELIRWMGEDKVERQGELFVYAWIMFTTFLYVVSFASKQYFTDQNNGGCDSALMTSCTLTLEVLVIYLMTRASKYVKVARISRKK
jgi:CDP-diglyceride synthetase